MAAFSRPKVGLKAARLSWKTAKSPKLATITSLSREQKSLTQKAATSCRAASKCTCTAAADATLWKAKKRLSA